MSSPSPKDHSIFSSSLSTKSCGTFLAFKVLASRHTIANLPSINVSHSSSELDDVEDDVDDPAGRSDLDPCILTTTSIEEFPVQVTKPENRKFLSWSANHFIILISNRMNSPDIIPIKSTKHIQSISTCSSQKQSSSSRSRMESF